MKNSLLLLVLLILIGCKETKKQKPTSQDDVDAFMENVFGEKKSKPKDCSKLIADADFSKICISKQDDYRIKKDLENPLVCIHVMKAEDRSVDIAINYSTMVLITGQVYQAAKSDASKKGKVKKVKNIGQAAFYVEYAFSSGDYKTQNRDLIFYEGQSMYTLHTVNIVKNGNKNCMSNQSQLKKLAKSLLKSSRKK